MKNGIAESDVYSWQVLQKCLTISGDEKVLEAGEYRIRKTLAKIPGQEDNIGRGYLCGNRELQVWDRYEEYEPGERVSVNGSVLTVAEKTSYIKNSQWLNCYGFMEPHACRTETIRTPRPSGVAVRGNVIEADMDRSRLRLVTDGFGESPESTHLCPVYYAGSGKGYSGQPEKGDVQYLYFPTGQDKDRYVIGCVDAGSEKMEQLGRQERDENVGLASEAGAAGEELSEVKRWNTPGNRRMVLNRNGVSFADSWKGGLNVQCGGIRVWTNGNMALEAEKIVGDGRKITAEAGDYVWIGSGSSGMILLPDQVQISAADVYMKSPLNWLHKIIDEETTETLLDLYEEMKTLTPPVMAPDGTVIRRDGYDDILHSEELYDYFLNHVVGKEEGYERNHDEPYVTLYEKWLDETYGHSAMWYFWDYVFSIDGLQTMLSIAGLFYHPIHYVNAAIYLLRGNLKEAGKSAFIGVTQKYLTLFFKELAAIGYDGSTVGITSDDVVKDLYFRYLAEERSAELLAEIGPLSEETINSIRYSMNGMGIAEGIFYKDLTITAEVVDSEGNVIGTVTTGCNDTVISPGMEEKILYGQRKNPAKNELIGGHSPDINNNNPNYAVEVLNINPDGTQKVKFVTQYPDGNLSKIKTSTLFPNSWSNDQIMNGIKMVGNSTPIGVRASDGAKLYRSVVNGVQIEVIKIGNNVISAYPTGGLITGLLPGFSSIK